MKPVHLPILVSLCAALAVAQAVDGPSPAKVANAVKETELATIPLTPQAEQRLGIKLAAIERRAVPHTQLLPGEIVLPLGTTAAPMVGGTLDERLKLADQQTDADGRIEQARVQVEAARITLERAQKVLNAEAGSVRAVDDAKAQVRLAEAALETAKERRALLGGPVEQALASARLWVRVAVYGGQLEELDRNAPASVSALAGGGRAPSVSAKAVSGPQTANAAAATVDLFYELSGTLPGLRPGARVAVTVPLKGSSECLVAPWAAVLHDIHGGQWVYENTAPQTFVRRRVQVARVVGSVAVLASGPAVGAKVVTDGAAELFGTEFGIGK